VSQHPEPPRKKHLALRILGAIGGALLTVLQIFTATVGGPGSTGQVQPPPTSPPPPPNRDYRP
jgi:hypothetical protein